MGRAADESWLGICGVVLIGRAIGREREGV